MQSFACGGGISAVIQFILIIFPEYAEKFQGLIPITLIAIISIIFGISRSWPRPIEIEFSAPKTKIKIIKGDLLEQDEHIVIGICNTFDTETPHIVSKTSLLGQSIDKLFGGDIKKLDELLEQALSDKTFTIREPIKNGKNQQYELGTVAVVDHSPRLVYYLAYCRMSDRNEAFGTVDSVWKSLLYLWDAQSERGNHRPISIPVIGGGQARMSNILPAQDSIRLIILSFMFASREHKISDELRIIVQPNDYDRLDRMELQSFLSSLRPS
ncbi:macro domain-containing protein [Acinetobacter proteolyticus]|uniref:macro domain-containing protein n=1 Tax=Acinetobacter proteolyticus TaxID=1776741 RepID=UPI0012FF16D0|nr:macro domain-containing protein [Acinetobacter proteolyticus]